MRKHHDNQIILYGFPRELLLSEICRRLDVISVCNRDNWLNMRLLKVTGNTYQGHCPYCGEEESFTLNRKTGAGGCSNCRGSVDFLDLMSYYRKRGLFAALNFIEILIAGNDRRKARERCKNRMRGQGFSGGGAA